MGEEEWVEADVMISYDPERHQVIHTQISTGEVIHRFNLNDGAKSTEPPVGLDSERQSGE